MIRAFAFATLVAALAPAGAVAAPPIILDGSTDEWASIEPVRVDPADAPGGPGDVRAIHVAHDAEFVHLLIDFGRPVNALGLDGFARIAFDADGDPTTGCRTDDLDGVDVVMILSPPDPRRKREPGRGAALEVPRAADAPVPRGLAPTPYDIGWESSPSTAASRIECRLRRGSSVAGGPPLFMGRSFAARVRLFDRQGRLHDDTEPYTWTLSPVAPAPPIDLGPDPLGRPAGTELRLVTWNVEFGALIKEPAPFQAVLAQLDPDVIAFQELKNNQAGSEIEAVLNAIDARSKRRPWRVVFGEGGGNLRCAIASRVGLAAEPTLRVLPFPGIPNRQIRIAAARVPAGDQTVLVVSLHLVCCGRAGDDRDLRRVKEAKTLRGAIQAIASASGGAVPVIIAGDYNLVGSMLPLTTLQAGLDLDGTELQAAPAMRLDGRSNSTWSKSTASFTPGRLDYVLYSDAALELRRSFTFETADLPSRVLSRCGLRAEHVASASDHRPIVADFAAVPRAVAAPTRGRRE